MTEQELRVKQADDLLHDIERTLLLEKVFNRWMRYDVADKIKELHRMAVEPREDNAKH